MKGLQVVYLARHGETLWSLSGQHTGLTDLPLTTRGECNARLLGERLKGLQLARVFTSPLQRARRTCELAGFGSRAEVDRDLVEWSYGDYDGLTAQDIRTRRPNWTQDLRNVVDMDAIRAAGLKLGVDPLGGAARPYWEPINAIYKLDISVVNPVIDPTFSFMTVDHDGQIRMDCSSPYAMARLVGLKDEYQVAFANDPDSDRHGIVTALRRFDESESLSGGCHPIPFGESPPMAQRYLNWQNRCEQQHA